MITAVLLLLTAAPVPFPRQGRDALIGHWTMVCDGSDVCRYDVIFRRDGTVVNWCFYNEPPGRWSYRDGVLSVKHSGDPDARLDVVRPGEGGVWRGTMWLYYGGGCYLSRGSTLRFLPRPRGKINHWLPPGRGE